MNPLHSPIQVSLRLKPLDPISPDPSILSIDPQFPNTLLLTTGSDVPKAFTFDHIFSETCSQSTIFSTIANPLLLSCLEGYNVCIFAYGQTGAGKTYTILGPDNMQEKGLVPRTIDELFSILSNNHANKQTVVKASFLEIYNEQIIDLLDNSKKNLSLREDLRKGVYVEGLSEEAINDSFEAQELLRKGSRIRHIGATSMNIESSRSHSVFTLFFETKRKLENGVLNIKSSKLSFVDLAGSERQKNVTLISGERLKEGCNINRSLHVLGNVINALVEVTDGKTRHIHYRDSKLTFLLKDSLGGNSKTSLIANVNQGSHYFQETFSTIKFAKRVKMIKNSVFINEDITGSSEGLRQEIRRLKQEILSLQLHKGTCFNPNKLNHEKNSDFKNHGEKSNENYEALLKKFVENSYEVETLLQEELTNSKQEKTKLHEFIKEFHGLEENYRLIISLQKERLKRNSTQFDDLLMKENEELRDLLKHMPYLVKLFEENLLLKTEPAPFNETRINNDVLFQSLQQNIIELKEIKNFLQENAHIEKSKSINIKENVHNSQNSGNMIENENILLINENNITMSKNNEIPPTINEIEAISPIKIASTHHYNDQNMVSKELYDEMQLKFTEKIELLNLELIENRPNNGFLQQKLLENQDALEIAYEKISSLEAELEDYRIKIKELSTITENKCQELLEKPASECVFQEKILEKELCISQLQEANGFLKEEIVSTKENILRLNEKISFFEVEGKEKNNEIDSKNKKIEEIHNQLKENESVIQIKEESIVKLKFDLQEKQTSLLEKIKELEHSNKEINQLQEELNQKILETDERNKKYNQIEDTLKEKDSNIKEITQKNEELTSSIHEKQQKLLEYQTVLEENIRNGKKMEEEIMRKNELIKQFEEQNTQFLNEKLNQKNENFKNLEDSRQRINEKNKIINEKDLLIDVLQNSLSEKEQLISELNAHLQESRISLIENNRLLEIKSKDFAEKSQLNQQLIASLDEKNQQINKIQQDLQEKTDINFKLSQEIKQKTIKIQELEQISIEGFSKHQEILSELEKKSQAIDNFNEKIKTLNTKLEVLTNELEEKSQKINSQALLLNEKEQLIKEITQNLSQKTAFLNEKEIIQKENQGELASLQEYMRSLEKSHEDLQKKSSSLTMELGLSIEKFDALQTAHETLQTRYDNLEKGFAKKQGKLQKDLEIKANNSQELVKRIEILSKESENKSNLFNDLTKKLELITQENEKIKRKHEKHIEELEIKHSETIKTLYDERKEQLEEMLKEKEEAAEGEIEQYKRLIANLKKQVSFCFFIY